MCKSNRWPDVPLVLGVNKQSCQPHTVKSQFYCFYILGFRDVCHWKCSTYFHFFPFTFIFPIHHCSLLGCSQRSLVLHYMHNKIEQMWTHQHITGVAPWGLYCSPLLYYMVLQDMRGNAEHRVTKRELDLLSLVSHILCLFIKQFHWLGKPVIWWMKSICSFLYVQLLIKGGNNSSLLYTFRFKI